MSLRADLKLSLRRKVDLARYTTMHASALADYFAEPASEDEFFELLEFARQENLSWFILGRGSNVIFIRDLFPGIVISMNRFHSQLIEFHPEMNYVTASAGVQLYRLTLACRDASLGGTEFLASIPGSLGGACMMNAGFSRHPGQKNEIGDLLREVTVLNSDGAKEVLKKESLKFSYRKSNLQGKIILSASLQLWHRPKEVIEEEIRANFEYRAKEQDVRYPSSGSIFKNPLGHEMSAGRLIDSLGLKGFKVGDAMISEQHANYMVNLGNAKGSDFVELIEKVKKVVLNETGVTLETEVVLV